MCFLFTKSSTSYLPILKLLIYRKCCILITENAASYLPFTKFFESQNSDAKNAGQALEYIRELYAIERHAKDERLSPDEIVKLRQAKSVPILAEIESWMKALLPTLNPTSPLTKAIAYTLPRWKELVHYTTDGALSIDNNAVENAIRPVAVTRKNFLFLGSHEGGVSLPFSRQFAFRKPYTVFN